MGEEEIDRDAALHIECAAPVHPAAHDLRAPRVVRPRGDRFRTDDIDVTIQDERVSPARARTYPRDIWPPREGHTALARVRELLYGVVEIPHVGRHAGGAELLRDVCLRRLLLPQQTRPPHQLRDRCHQLVTPRLDGCPQLFARLIDYGAVPA